MADAAYEGWALVEQMGFRKTVGKVSEAEVYGTKMLRLDVPVLGDDGQPKEFVTRFCGGPSLYQVTPIDETLGLSWAKQQSDPRPVRPTSYQISHHGDDDGEDDGSHHE